MMNQSKLADKHNYWRSKIEEWNLSGLSQTQFCRQHNLKQNTFSGWKRKLDKINQTAPKAESSDFVSVKVSSKKNSSNSKPSKSNFTNSILNLQLPSGAVLSWSVDVKPDYISTIISRLV